MIERRTHQVAPDETTPTDPVLAEPAASEPSARDQTGDGPTAAPTPEPHAPEAATPAPAVQAPPTPITPIPARPTKPQQTLVVEEGLFPSRLRRPRDLLSGLLALVGAALVVIIAVTAEQTVLAIDDDLANAQRSLPDLIWGGLSSLAGLGLILLPLIATVSLLLRRRGRQLLEAIAAMTVAAIALTLISTAVREYGSQTLYFTLTGSTVNDELAYPTNPLLGALIAFITVARLMSRPRWNVLIALMVGITMVVGSVSSGSTTTAQLLSYLVGLSIGLLTRYLLGTPTTRPAGSEVAGTLLQAGIPLVMLRARAGTESGRHYMGVRADGGHLDVVVLDRDLEGSGVASALWRSIRLRESNDSASGLSMGGQVDRASMMSYAAEVAGVPSPRLALAAMVSADSALLAYESADGRYVTPGSGTQSDRPTDEELEVAWRAVAAMQARFLAHQNLNAEHVRYAGAATHLTGMESGTVAAGDVVLRLDIAELLVTQALQTDAPTAVAAARRVLGDEAVLRGLPVLQRVALSGPTRTSLRANKNLINELREELLEINPAVDMAPIDLERLKPRTLFTLLLGTVAGYLLLSQLAQVNVTEVLATADWRWAAVALVLSMLTYVGATLSLSGFVPDRLSFLRTLQAQFAASFATLVSPPTLGAVAVNGRLPEPFRPAAGCCGSHGRGVPGGGVHRARGAAGRLRHRRRHPVGPAVQPTARGHHRCGGRGAGHRWAGLGVACAALAGQPDPPDSRAGHPPAGDRRPAPGQAGRGVRRDPAAQPRVLPVPGGLGARVLRQPHDRRHLLRLPGRIDPGPGCADARRLGRGRGRAGGWPHRGGDGLRTGRLSDAAVPDRHVLAADGAGMVRVPQPDGQRVVVGPSPRRRHFTRRTGSPSRLADHVVVSLAVTPVDR